MSRIFLSHSSNNNAEAIALHDWLIDQGWNELFLDLDPERGLKAGQRWQEALKQAADRCEVVLFLISPAWAASKWCLAEFLLAKQLGKPIFGVIVEPTPFAEIPIEMTAEWQLVDLTAGAREHERTVTLAQGLGTATVKFSNDGLARLRIGLMQSGLDPKYFKWPPDNDPDRAPYRGLKSLDAEDAGILFGREGAIVLGLDSLRSLRENPPPRILVILGASGAGKSSFMRAGLLPRLEREDQRFLPLPVIRPERAALTGDTGLIASIEIAFKAAGQPKSRADIRAAVEGGISDLAPLLASLVAAKAQKSGGAGKHATIVIPVDQAEELFTGDGAREGQVLLRIVGKLVAQDAPSIIALFTMRSDNYEPLQTAHELDGLRQHFLSLGPMPHGEYAEVIRGPARRLDGTKRALKIDETLVSALLADIQAGGSKDALPLLAFTLERLYSEYHAGGHLTLQHYNALGRVQGSIEAAVERAFRAADDNPKIPRDRDARLALLRRGLIPWLAGIDPDTGAPRRRVARLSEIPAEARPLIDLLVDQRLLSTDVAKDTGETTIEPTHEALLRQWGMLHGWLTEDAGLLAVLDGIKRAARDWAANGKRQAWIAHTGERLATANRLAERSDLAANLEPTDRQYLEASRMAEREAWGYFQRVRAGIGGLAVLLIAVGVGWWQQDFLREQYQWRVVMGPTVLTPEEETKLRAADEFSECKNGCPTMVVIPAGKFMMGSAESGDRFVNERPQHEVTFAKPFAVGKFDATFAEWDMCAEAGACPRNSFVAADDDWGRGNQPVIHVSWNDAKLYVSWLSRMTHKEYRLLSEAEWEYAARAGTTTAYYWGNEVSENVANCRDCRSRWNGLHPSPVGSFKPNTFGLYDMHGNVRQWVEDTYQKTYEGAPNDGSAWVQEAYREFRGIAPIFRVVRGSSWRDFAFFLSAIERTPKYPDERDDTMGFRIARTLTH
jgi:formylglycine-generating enzyme required for sulfatase activity